MKRPAPVSATRTMHAHIAFPHRDGLPETFAHKALRVCDALFASLTIAASLVTFGCAARILFF